MIRFESRARWLVLFLPVMAACEGTADSPADVDRLTEADLTPIPLGNLEASVLQTLEDSTLYRPIDLVGDGSRLYVAESLPGRVSVLDRDLKLIRRIGRRGRGPGDLYQPWTVDVRDGVLSVSEFANGRTSLFSVEGEFLDILRHDGLPRHAALSNSTWFAMTGPAHPYRGFVLTPRRSPIGVGAPDPADPVDPGTAHQAAVVAIRVEGEDFLAVVNPTSGTVERLDARGRAVRRFVLPAPVREEFAERHRKAVEGAAASGWSLGGFSALKGFGASSSRRYAVLGLLADIAPFLIYDFERNVVHRLEVTGHPFESTVRNASDAFLDDDRIYIMGQGNIYAFGIELPR